MSYKSWFVVDEDNNTFAGPFKNIKTAAKIADSISKIHDKRKLGIIENSRLDELRKKYIECIISEHSIFHKLN
tara:strand:- start:7697 stop:7915 length:219 start_codon:yes stop_codon:yes gene_type:complete